MPHDPSPAAARHRRSLWLLLALLLVPLAAAIVVAWRSETRSADLENGLRQALGAAADNVPRGSAEELIRRAGEQVRAAQRLQGETARREDAERELADAQAQVTAGKERGDRLEGDLARTRQVAAATASRQEAAQAQAGQTVAGQRQAQDQAAAAQAETTRKDQALEAQRARASDQAEAATQARTALGQAQAGDAGQDAALADARSRLETQETRTEALEATADDLGGRGPGSGNAVAPSPEAPAGRAAPRVDPALERTPAGQALIAFDAALQGQDRLEFPDPNRLVVRSSTLFPRGDAEISGEGRTLLTELARRLNEATGRFPPDLDWEYRVEGHADDVPVRDNAPFASNWELSATRASSVVDYLVAAGVPGRHLAVAAFADTRPLVAGNDEEARERNRRIEVRLLAR